jgi:hypothetical protein
MYTPKLENYSNHLRHCKSDKQKHGSLSVYNSMNAKKFVLNKKGDVGMWVGSHPKSAFCFIDQ